MFIIFIYFLFWQNDDCLNFAHFYKFLLIFFLKTIFFQVQHALEEVLFF